MNGTVKFEIPGQVVARMVGSETVILDLESGTYFGLDEIGARLWQLIESGRTLSEVCDAMALEYDAPRDVLERDTMALAKQLVDKKLLRAL